MIETPAARLRLPMEVVTTALLTPLYWDGTQASNLQPADLETAALPIELIPYGLWWALL